MDKRHKRYRILAIPITLVFIAVVLALEIPNPMIVLIVPVVFFSYSGGYIAGAMSGIITVSYSFWFFFSRTIDVFAVEKIMTIVAAVTIIIILVGRLESAVRKNNQVLRQKLEEQAERLNETHFAMVNALSTVVEFRDLESGEHIRRVRDYTSVMLTLLADEYGLTPERIRIISNASVMHDIGKISIPDNILLKPGKLTAEEFEIMKTHTLKGCDMLEALELSHTEEYVFYYDICRHHHERWDGGGYPDGLKGDEISIWSQVIALADVYDALTSVRVYKPAYSHERAVQMILDGECGAFNPLVIERFREHSDEFLQLY